MTIKKIVSVDDLYAIQKHAAEERAAYQYRAMVCSGTPCRTSESLLIKDAMADAIKRRRLEQTVDLIEVGCMGFCAVGPVMLITPGEFFYQRLTVDDIPELVEEHFVAGRPVERLFYKDPATGESHATLHDIPFIALQKLLVLRNGGLINPERIEDYIGNGGYRSAFKALREMTAADIISEVKTSGLRGRGGAGFPTGLKWEFCANSKGAVRYTLCNADEGDPGAFMDRSVLESDPHSVLEGMIIAAKAINSHQGYIYCRAEYPLAVKRVHMAIAQARSYGLLGKDIFGSGFEFDLDIYKGAGAFVCGEETALMTSIEGRRGVPRPRPPFPAISGLWEKPTILNNVETYANVSYIIMNGGEEYAKTGTETAKGTKIFSLSGKVNLFGLVEVPMGTPIGKIVFDIGGGMIGDKKFKAVQLGGPSGGCLPAKHLNTPIDYEEIAKAGAIMGSGGMIVMDEDTCMVDMARFFMAFCQDESCGKCTACRIGTRRMLEILERICLGHGRDGDIELLKDLAQSIKDTALCGLGQTAPNPVLSTIRYFRNEYEAHIQEKRCPAVVCAGLFTAPCQHMCSIGMDIPAYIALIRAERFDDAHNVLKQTNPLPAVCGRVCGHLCQSKCRRSQLDAPLAIKNLKRFITDHAGRPPVDPIPVTRSEKIAAIGAGPAGLTFALEMKQRGYGVTVFETMPEAGGMLRWGIPEYRLPRDVLAREIQDILDTGVVLHTNTCIGKDVSLETLDREYDLIFIATGAQKSMPLGLPNDDAQGAIGAVEMLRAYNKGEPVDIGRRVIVVGGGNSAVDAARTAVRLGAKTVKILYRRERKDMPALDDEILAAEAEGVQIEYLAAPVKIHVSQGKISGLQITRMRLEQFDSSGRRRPVPVGGSETEVTADTIIAAIGQCADIGFLTPKIGVETSNNAVTVNPRLKTTHPKILAGGDVVTGPAMVIDAIKAGRDAAESADAEFRAAKGETPWIPIRQAIEIPIEVDEEAEEQPQTPMPELAPSKRIDNFKEVELGYTPDMAFAEARRCMRCDAKNRMEKAA